MCAFEQKHQILMVSVKDFAPVEDERYQVPADHPGVVAGIAFMKPLLEKYCAAELEQHELQPLKKQLLKDHLGVSESAPPGARKRPAAAQPLKTLPKTEALQKAVPGCLKRPGAACSGEATKKVRIAAVATAAGPGAACSGKEPLPMPPPPLPRDQVLFQFFASAP